MEQIDMNITQVKLFPVNGDKLLAYATITYEKQVVVTGLKVLSGANGLWVAMPSSKNDKNEYNDIVFPVTKEARQHIQDTVLNEFKKTEKYDGEKKPQGNFQDGREQKNPTYEKVDNRDMYNEPRQDFTKLQEDPNGLHKKPDFDVDEEMLPF
jgi:stage V sporulation protein G